MNVGDHILALDGGTACGWMIARVTEHGLERVDSGTFRLAPDAAEGEADGHRFLRLWKRLGEIRDRQLRITRVAMERPIKFKTWQATQVCYGMTAFAQAWCARYGLPPVDLVNPQDLKTLAKVPTPKHVRREARRSRDQKRAEGRARSQRRAAGKKLARAKALELFGHIPQTDDEADAMLVGWISARRGLEHPTGQLAIEL